MAQQFSPTQDDSQAPERRTRTTPQFVGGSVDENSGNIISATAADAERGRPDLSQTSSFGSSRSRSEDVGTTGRLAPEPRTPTTRLGGVSATTTQSLAPSLLAPMATPGFGMGAQGGSSGGFAGVFPAGPYGGYPPYGYGPSPTLPSQVSPQGQSPIAPLGGTSTFIPDGYELIKKGETPATPAPAVAPPTVQPYTPPAPPAPAAAPPPPPQQESDDGGGYGMTMAGAAIGASIGGPVGAVVGGAIGFVGDLFCHAAGTRVRMENGSFKNIEDLEMGDRLLLGGAVIGQGKVYAADMYRYKGTLVNGRHAVFEDGRWVRVSESNEAEAVEAAEPTLVYPVVTENHLYVTEHYVCADLAEIDQDIGAVKRLEALNADEARNRALLIFERELSYLAQPLAA